ncbi:type IV pilin N-terminal domain-containing protein [Methanoregula sp.]|uniref:type IV pilin N-terminal domain-containing protein n=1 Tax=Methanoregula sp. TaxID=2052170 RepID=UPI003C755441
MGKTEEGVSPVVGVMLMLSVTVIIAAIVSAAAGGFSGTRDKAPSAILDVHFYENRSYGSFSAPSMTIGHISGSPLQTKDLSITTYFTNASGQMIKGYLIGEKAVPGNDSWTGSNFNSNTYSGVLFINDQDRFGPPLQSSGTGYESWFGNASAVLMPGDVLVTPAQFCSSVPPVPSESHINPGLNYILNFDTTAGGSGYQAGAIITVRIVHIPTGQVIFDKDVVVE